MMKKLFLILSLLYYLLAFTQEGCDAFALKADMDNHPEFSVLIQGKPELIPAWKYFHLGNVPSNIRISPEWLTKLSDDLNNSKYNLAELFDESPEDVLNIWKKLKDDPYWAQDFAKETTDLRWLKWKDREFFIEVTSKGKAFETFVYDNLAVLRSKILSKYMSIDINDYEVFTQVQLKTGVGDEYFVADIVLVKRKTDEFSNVILDLDNSIVVETKLNYGTNLTTPQSNGLIKVQSNNNIFDIRSVSNKSKSEIYTISNTENLKINDFIKVWSDGTGNSINDIISLK